MDDRKPGDVLKSVLSKKEQLKEAMDDTTVGVRKDAVAKKREAAAPPADDGSPTKYNTPRDRGEDMVVYADRLKGLQAKYKAK